MRTCRRQPSTLARSPRSISAVSTLSLISPPFAFLETNPPVRKLVRFRHAGSGNGELAGAGAEALAGACEQLVHAPGELREAGLEHRSLRIRLGHQRLEAAAELGLHVAEAALQALDELLALPLEPGGDSGQPLLESLGAGVAHVGEPLREHAVGLPPVCLDAAVELARQPARRVLSLSLDCVRELLRGRVGVAGGAAGDRALELLHLPPLHVGEARLDASRGFGLLALDLLSEGPLSAAQTLVELVKRAPSLALGTLEFGTRRRGG